ncbi:ATP-dependent zinc metalloprotease FtsH [Synoicihabitans lomoniglobus]|uniref:ATP-dependent zinc metalloprotease FtsH n=1 Tax=Synoicihabitans lomoniglobus TaxID=2909285 RepID=A0AAF0CQP3_9BACT|nr:ATP-dependent zinc metalloprotease FtsH [Opitutaceae bacterium LMO-M01]WED66309.1 ATP-dependent zinc metalloprotease FtsH [Opitutaceae bacterium LMO-M01]
MPEPDQDKKRKPLRSPTPDRFQMPKVFLVWIIIIGALVALWVFNPNNVNPAADLRISQVVGLAEQGQIKSGTIQQELSGGRDWAIITGETKEANFTNAKNEKTAAFRADGRLTDANIEKLQATGLFDERPATTFLTTLASQIIPFMVIIGLLYFLFVRQLRNAGKGAMSFGKSKAKLLQRDRDKVTFKNVAGCDEAKEEIAEVVDFLRDPKKFQKMGGKIPKGILLVGPPGTGKTLLAKAVAGEADVPFFSVSGSDFVEMFVGVGASRVRDMFEQGRKNAPCIIFIDEIDAVGRQRGAGLGGGNDEREQTLNSLLVEMDGFDTTDGVIIIAATNRPDVLDAALLRPGRFDRQVHVDLPDLIGREQILRVHARKIALSDEVDLKRIAQGTPGLSGAELANLLNESALLAARRNKKKVEPIDIEDAREKVFFGRERRRVMDDDVKQQLAWHEGGHAVVQAVLDDGSMPVFKVTILPRAGSLGSMTSIPTKDILLQSKETLLNRICVAMAGRVGEKLITGSISSGASGDISSATRVARAMVCNYGMSDLGPIAMSDDQDTVFLGRDITRSQHVSDQQAQRIDSAIANMIDEQYKRAETIINEHRTSLEKIAEALLEHETIEGRHVMEIIEHGEVRSPIVSTKPIEESVDASADDKGKGKNEPESGMGAAGNPAPSPA